LLDELQHLSDDVSVVTQIGIEKEMDELYRELLGCVKETETQSTSIGVLPGGVGRIKSVI
jgi:hypothetical protein